MRVKTLIALSLGLILLVTLATPALAGKPKSEDWDTITGEPGTAYGQWKVQSNHDYQLKATVVLKEASQGQHYYLYVYKLSNTTLYPAGDFYTNSKGNARYRGVVTLPTGGNNLLAIIVSTIPSSGNPWGDVRFNSGNFWFWVKPF